MGGPSFNPGMSAYPMQRPWPKPQPMNSPIQWGQQSPPDGSSNQPAPRPNYAWNLPNEWINSAKLAGNNVRDELQKKFPGEYAHLIGWKPFGGIVRNVKQTSHVMNEVANHRPVKDHELITFDDNMKRAASLGIATLATIGLKQRIFGVGEYLGFLSWFGAMAATPEMINAMVHLKTGVNLSQSYDSTYGQRLNLYKDPNYLPLHILSDEKIEKAADKLGIPKGPNRRQDTEEKMRQISVQAHTWWMLAAGPATPVISGLACDLLQDPATRAVNAFKRTWANMEVKRGQDSKLTPAETMAKRTHVYLKQVVGDVPESELSTWWKQFGQGIVKHAGLSKAMPTKTITKGSRAAQMDTLVNHLATLAQPGNTRLQKTIAFLDQQYVKAKATPGQADSKILKSGKLAKIGQKAEGLLTTSKKDIQPEELKSQISQVEERMLNAESTVNHYRQLFNVLKEASGKGEIGTQALKDKIRAALSTPNINTLQGLLITDYPKAQDLVNDPDIFNQINLALKNDNRHFDRAFKLMGASPEKHLLEDALKSVKLGNMWRTRMGLYLGGGLLGATALYNFVFMGRDFNKPQPKPPGGPA